MGKSLSVIKSFRVNARKRAMNDVYRFNIRATRRLIKKAMLEKNANEMYRLYKEYVSLVDKAIKKSILHKNTGARRKSRMNAACKKIMLENNLKVS